MALRRKGSARRRAGFCPRCDAPLPGELADEAQPVCPACGEELLPVRVAGVFRRTAAGLVDLALLFVTAGLLNWGLLAMLDPPPLLGNATGLGALMALLEISPLTVLQRITPALIMSGLYFGLFWTAVGRTPGQRLLGLRVVGRRGGPPSPLWAAVRVVAKFVAAVPALLGWIWVVFDREKRAWHDHLAGTYVITES